MNCSNRFWGRGVVVRTKCDALLKQTCWGESLVRTITVDIACELSQHLERVVEQRGQLAYGDQRRARVHFVFFRGLRAALGVATGVPRLVGTVGAVVSEWPAAGWGKDS
jgi:hypothetical protein